MLVNEKQLELRLQQFHLMNMKPNFSQLAKEIGIDRHTISKKYYGKEVFKPRERRSQLDPYKEEIRDMLSDPTILISSAYFYFTDEERNEKKITCTLSNFTKYVKKHRLNQKITNHIAHPKFETDPGTQMQVDWVEDLSLVTIDGEILNFNLFSATLGYSRMHYFEYAPSKTKDDFMKYLLRSFKYFGGKTDEVLTDNMTAIVNINDNKKTIHPEIISFFKDLDVKLKLCKVRTPQTKGKCETSNKFAKWLLAYNHKIRDENHLCSIISRLNKKINNDIENTFLNRPPIVLFKEKEKEHLKQLTALNIENLDAEYAVTQEVPSTSLIYYKRKYYSVHPKYIGKRVSIVKQGKYIYIYFKHELIEKHVENEQKVNYKTEHYIACLTLTGTIKDDIEDYAKENLERLKNIK